MYSSLVNQIYHLAHYLIAFLLVFILVPRFLFKPVQGSAYERWLANFMRMLLFTILVSYLLVTLKLFEVLSLAAVMLSWVTMRSRQTSAIRQVPGMMSALFYDFMESPRLLVTLGNNRAQMIRAHWLRRERADTPVRSHWLGWLCSLSIFALIGVVVYIHSYAAVSQAATPLSDSYVDLAWVQYVNLRMLFHDGVYPQGFYIFMALLLKFSVINNIYIIKYTAPLDALLLMLTLYMSLYGWTRKHTAAFFATLCYGVFGHILLGDDWIRLAATESQEFGMIFVLPTAYFLLRFLRNRDHTDLFTAFAGMSVTGLIHPLAYLDDGIACLAVLLAYLLVKRGETLRPVWLSTLAGAASVIITLAPLGMGLMLGHPINSASSSFIGAHVASSYRPALGPVDFIALGVIVLLAWRATQRSDSPDKRTVWLFMAVYGASTFALYDVGGALTHSIVIATRSLDLWGYTEALLLGVGVQEALSLLPAFISKPVAPMLMTLAILGSVLTGQIKPILPYTMQWSQNVYELLQINKSYRTSGYMIVSADAEDYDLVLGNGYFMTLTQFLQLYNPAKPTLTRYGAHQVDHAVASNVFLLDPKKVFEVGKQSGIWSFEAPYYAQERKLRTQFAHWLHTYKEHHGKVSVYYQDAHVVIYQFVIPLPQRNSR